MGSRTPLYDTHLAAGARTVDFGGWDMPLHYGSQIEEHHAVRRDAGMFDVSHMLAVDLQGAGVRDYLRRVLANDVARLQTPGKALYSCMLNESGGVLDDLIAYYLSDAWYRVVLNAGTRAKDLAWLERHAAGFEVEIRPRTDLAIIAVQGPNARAKAAAVLGAPGTRALELDPFVGREFDDLFISRTGYTGEDGWEIMLPAAQAPGLWQALAAAGVTPCGLGARDTLRLEAGFSLYGSDMDEQVTPLEAGLGWTVAFEPAERAFIGREALEAQRRAGVTRKTVGLLLDGRGVLRSHQPVMVSGTPVGEVTSGTFSPTLQRSIGLARVAIDVPERVEVDLRGRPVAARIVKYPFVRHGQVLVG